MGDFQPPDSYKKNSYKKEAVYPMMVLITGLIKTTDHRPTDHSTTYHLPIDPPTTYPPTHRPTDPPTAYHELTLKQSPDSKHVLYSKVYENFRNHLFPE